MMIVKRIREVYPLLNVLRLMRVAKPLIGVRGAFEFYTAPIKWLTNLGRLTYEELPLSRLLLSSKYGLFYIHAGYTIGLFLEIYEIENIMSKLVGKDTVFVDVGAYLGFYTLWACKRVRRVISIEPNPEALVYLKANSALNKCSNVTVIPKAVSDRRGFTKLKIPKTPIEGFIPGNSSIVQDYSEALEVGVEMVTLDNILDEIGVDEVDFIKVDVEGAEGLVVKGAQKNTRKS